jgi:hypothetical protein
MGAREPCGSAPSFGKLHWETSRYYDSFHRRTLAGAAREARRNLRCAMHTGRFEGDRQPQSKHAPSNSLHNFYAA